MKRFTLLFGIAFSLMLFLAAAKGAWAFTHEFEFPAPEISKVIIAGVQFDRVSMPGCPNGGNTGEPALPARGAQILLPFGTEVSTIEIDLGERVSLGSDYFIEPVSRPVKLSADIGPPIPPAPDEAIYGSDRPFPETQFEEIGTCSFRGYQILTLKLQPVQYIPTSGELYYYPNLTVVINTVESDRSNALFRGLPIDEEEVLWKIDNPENVGTYYAGGIRTEKSFDLLILTTTSLASNFQPLKDYHDAHGIITEIHTTSDVGSNDPDDVRDYIRDRYLADGIDYVLIGADDDIIPAKDLYVQAYSGGDIEYNMPADIYFGCLDGTYNYDGDSYWGEPNDGEGGGDVDLVAEVYVGRASVGNSTEATRFVNKTIDYLSGQHSHYESVLMVGEYLGFGGESEYAGNMMDQLIDGSDADNYTTVGIPSDIYSVDKLYDRDWPGNDWPQSELITRINNGLHILNHLGHGSPDYAMKIYDHDIMDDLTNDDLCFVYSQTCLAGHFDGTDCWAEYMNIKTDNGGYAVVMNARFGWGTYNSTDGPSQRFNREFWDAVFDLAESKLELGRANHDSKEDNLYRINESCMRWCYYELNLFGDPTVAVKGVSGLRVAPGEDFVSEGPGGGPFEPVSIDYTLDNMGDDGINYNVTKSQPWITLTNASGYLAGHASTTVTVSINSNANGLDDGRYEDVINFINETDHVGDTERDVVLNVGVPVVVYEWTLDSNPGWTTEDQWAFGQPTGGGGEYGGPDPTSGQTGSNTYGYNLYGDYQNYLPERHLTTDAIDCTGLFNVHLKFWRWLGVEQPSYDHAYVRVSSDGSNWTTIWQNTAEVADYSWVLQEFDISSVADDQPTVYLRWTMGTTDGGWVYCGWNIDDIQLIAIGGELPALFIFFPDGLPEHLEPGVPTTVAVQIVDGDENYVPGTGLLYYRYDGGTYLASPLVSIGGNIYEGTLPPPECGDTPEFYVSAQGDGGSTVYDPSDAPNTVYTALVGAFITVFEDDFETDKGWIAENLGATSGDWQRGVPVNDPGWDYDPISDFDGSGQCYLTQNEMGNTDVDDGAVRLTSPTIDMSGGEINISYAYYLYLTETGGGVDRLLVEIDGNDGAGPWIEIAMHISDGGLSWRTHTIDQADLDAAGVVPTSTTKLRFTANDADPQSINEAGIDAVSIVAFTCGEVPTGAIAGTVRDASTENIIEEVLVEAIGTVASDYTDQNGQYTLYNLPVGVYDVEFSHADYVTLTVEDVPVSEDATYPLDVMMEPVSQDIPTLSEWGMIIMALLLLAVGTVAILRRRKAAISKVA